MKRLLFWGMFFISLGPALACGPALPDVTPTPTKTPRLIRTVAPTPIPTVAPLATNTPVLEQAPATPTPVPPTEAPATPTSEAPPTDTPPPPPPPTDTPPPPPPPTNTPAPPPPTNTPAPPAPTQPPPSSEPQIIIELPDGDTYGVEDDVRLIITVRDPDGVASFSWGVFTQNQSSVGLGGDHNCGGTAECRIEESFETKLPGQFFVGVDAVDTTGKTKREVKQLYVG